MKTDGFVAHVVSKMMVAVEEFNAKVTGIVPPSSPRVLGGKRLGWAKTALLEEVGEFVEASERGDIAEAADGLVDLVYFALGRLSEMGVPAQMVFDGVHAANMRKVRGTQSKRPGSLGHDAVKPDGWRPPDHSFLLGFDDRQFEAAGLWAAVPAFLKRVVELRARKGEDYNSGPALRDYFPFGHKSYAQMLHVKVLRIESLIARMDAGAKPNFEGIMDSLMDVVNYSSFYAEWLEGPAQFEATIRTVVDGGGVTRRVVEDVAEDEVPRE